MRKRRFLSLLTAAFFVLSLAGCGDGQAVETTPEPTPTPVTETPAPVRTFTLPRTGGSLHPILSTDKVNLALSGLLWEGLFELDTSFTPQPLLCQSYTVSEDGLSWTFLLREGVTFSDGSPLTAADAAASLELARREQSRFAGRLAGVRGVSAGEGSVTVNLSAPNGALPALLDIPIIKAGGGEVPLGTGPYVLTGEGEETSLTARSGWWRNKVLPMETIPLQTIQEADDLIYAFDTGDISLVTADLTGTSALGFAGDHEVWDYASTTMVFVGYNCYRGPCASPALRRALDRGYDRATVAVALYSRHAQASAIPVPQASTLFDKALSERRDYSPQELGLLLGEAGYEKNTDGVWAKGGKPLDLTLIVNTDNTFRLAAAEYLATSLTNAGVPIELQKLSWADYQKALTAGNFDLYLGATALSADFDPAPLLTAGGALNFGRYQSAGVNGLLAGYQAASGPARRTAAQALWTALETEVPFSTLCFKSQSVLTQWGAVSGLTPTQQNPFYGMENWKLGR